MLVNRTSIGPEELFPEATGIPEQLQPRDSPVEGLGGSNLVLVTGEQTIFEITSTSVLVLFRDRLFGAVDLTVRKNRRLQILFHILRQHIQIAHGQVAFRGTHSAPG